MLRRQAAETDANADTQTVSSVLVGSLESVEDPPREDHADILDRFARLSERIRPYSLAAIGIAVASFAVSTLIRIAAGWESSELLFAPYVPAILGAGLLAGVPAASGVAMASILVLTWAFVPPYFQLKWSIGPDQSILLFGSVAYIVTIYFAHCCRVVLRRLRQREIANGILAKELAHRGKNLFSIVEVIVQKTLADDPERSKKIIERLRSIRNANELLASGKAERITLRSLLSRAFVPYGEDRLEAHGVEFDVSPEHARHLTLMFHELVTNAAKYGSLSCADGHVLVEWRWDGWNVVLTWKEIGGPAVVHQSKKGFGTQLISLCAKALSGTVQSSLSQDGFVCWMTLRLSE